MTGREQTTSHQGWVGFLIVTSQQTPLNSRLLSQHITLVLPKYYCPKEHFKLHNLVQYNNLALMHNSYTVVPVI